jgi:hypothetical protein
LSSDPAFTEEERTSFDVNYAFPLFPYLEPCWLEVEFSCPAKRNEVINEAIIRHLAEIKQKGFRDRELNDAWAELNENRRQISNNEILLSLIVDSCFANWDLPKNPLETDQEKNSIFEKIKACYPDPKNYSMILLQH